MGYSYEIDEGVIYNVPGDVPVADVREGYEDHAARLVRQANTRAQVEAKDAWREEWRPVAGWEGLYEVSDLGRVRNSHGVFMGQFQKCARTHRYYHVRLTDGRKRRAKAAVHRLVALAFCPNPLGKKQVNHIDHEPLNNVASNLEWTTQKENLAHMTKHGRRHLGGSHPAPANDNGEKAA